MKRLPLVVSFLLFIALCASIAYWAMQLFKPPVRPVAAPPRAVQPEIRTDAAMSLLGGGRSQGPVAVASNYQLKGVVVAGNVRESVAILSADGKPAQAVRAEMEILPGVTIREVHRDHVVLSEGGVTKRVELPESAKGAGEIANVAPIRTGPTPPPFIRPSQMATPPASTIAAPPPSTTVVMPPATQSDAIGSVPQPGASGGAGGGASGLPPNPAQSPEPAPAANPVPGSANSSGR
jgi:general secretion pathway protein C